MGVSGEAVTQFLVRCAPRCGSGACGEGYVAARSRGSVRVLGESGVTAREPGVSGPARFGDREAVSPWVVVGLTLRSFGAAPLSGVSSLAPRIAARPGRADSGYPTLSSPPLVSRCPGRSSRGPSQAPRTPQPLFNPI